ncbi:MAG: hypothetical protein NTZ20_05140 [Candidatus Levybacteria bacterium]|nr:hypothetical protein [Candidatus Levybacteria bacterium]
MTTPITRENIDSLLNSGKIEIAMGGGKWWRIRRNGATKHWKRDATRIYVPFKMGLKEWGNLTEWDFDNNPGNALNPNLFRVTGESEV